MAGNVFGLDLSDASVVITVNGTSQSLAAWITALLAGSGSSGSSSDTSFTPAALTTLLLALPTTPGAAGTLWLDSKIPVMVDGWTASSFISGTLTVANLETFFQSLPTSAPSGAGQAWLDDGIPTLTAGGTAGTYASGTLNLANWTAFLLSLPTALPSTVGQPWLNSGALAIS